MVVIKVSFIYKFKFINKIKNLKFGYSFCITFFKGEI